MAKIENHRYRIEEAFRDCFYIVPDYQREYVWSDKEVLQLLDDINEQLDGGNAGEYFIGMVLVSPGREQRSHYEVIDGQQRLTSLFLLLCALKYFFRGQEQYQTLRSLVSTSFTDKSGKAVTRLKLDPRYENAGELIAKIASLEADPQATRAAIEASGIRCYGSLENLLNAYTTIFRYIQDNYVTQQKLEKYWGYLANEVVFIQISTDVSNALKIFETINERGVGLNPMDLLKNLIFTQVRPDEFAQLKNEWKKITNPLEDAREKPLRFLRYFLMANYRIDNDRGDYVVREDEIYDWLTTKKNADMCGYAGNPFEFVRMIIRNVERYIQFVRGLGNDGQSSVAMYNLQRLTGGAFSLHYVLLLAASPLPRKLFDHFIRQLECFLFYYIFAKTPTKDLERSFSLWADELRAVSAEPDPSAQQARLDKFVEEKFQGSMSSKDAELFDALKRYTLHSMQQYRTKYLLAKLTQHVDMAYRGLREPGSLAEYSGLEIEHILPDNPEPDLRAAFVVANANADYDAFKNRLGNLTMLEKPINIVASNDFFEHKRIEYSKCKNYLTASIAGLTPVGKNSSITRINEKLLSFDEWNANSIDKRQELLIGLAKVVWTTRSMEA